MIIKAYKKWQQRRLDKTKLEEIEQKTLRKIANELCKRHYVKELNKWYDFGLSLIRDQKYISAWQYCKDCISHKYAIEYNGILSSYYLILFEGYDEIHTQDAPQDEALIKVLSELLIRLYIYHNLEVASAKEYINKRGIE